MKRRTKTHRSIYERHYGEIPREADGRTYEIHHIDGDHSNDEPTNLKAVTIKEHYDIHYAQKDWGACIAIEMRMSRDANLISELQKRRVKEGTHHLQSGDIQRAAGKANFDRIFSENRHTSQIKKTCVHCNKTCSINMYGRFHGDKCLKNPDIINEARIAHNRKRIHTSEGIFESRIAASRHFKITPQAVGARCKNANSQWSDWYYL